MAQRIDLTTGSITGKLVRLAIPIMGVSFMQMAYNLIDLAWIGRIGSNAVAAVGTAGFYTWLAMAFITISKLGAEIKVAQSIGQGDYKKAKAYVVTSLQINLVLAILFSIVLLLFKEPLIGFFKLPELEVIQMAKVYLVTVALGMIFYFVGPVFTAIFNGSGDSKTPFIINAIGLIFNIVFDPILIFGLGGFPQLGVFGAALATVLSQVIVVVCFIYVMLRKKRDYLTLNIWKKPDWNLIKEIVYFGLPAALQSGLFTIFSMIIGRIVTGFGPIPIAAQKIGSQMENISWMTAGGFATALGTYVGQNYGAKKYERIDKGVGITMGIASGVGAFATYLFVFIGEPLFSIFLPEAEAIIVGKSYLRILGYSQIFMCAEITITGAFSGLGRTYLPNIVSILLTGARIPIAYILCKPELLGLDGIWWTISMTSVVKGIALVGVYIYLKRKQKLFRIV